MSDVRFSTADYGAARLARFARWGMVPLRFVVGLVFLLHGGQKLFVFGLGGTADIMGKLGLPLPALCAVIVIAVTGLLLLLAMLEWCSDFLIGLFED